MKFQTITCGRCDDDEQGISCEEFLTLSPTTACYTYSLTGKL